ncbi:MAG: DUF3293 domain-containing protein [Longimicrobiaceae bacterium]
METPRGALTVRPGRPAPAPLRPSGIVTAFNPASRPLSPDANLRADAALRARIGALGLSAHRTLAHGTGDDAAAWDEPGWCLTGDARAEVIRLGADFGQNAVLWIDPAGEVSIVCTRDGFCGARVGEVVRMGDGERSAASVGPGG